MGVAALGGWVGAEGASFTVYPAVLSGWIYLVGVGADWWQTVPAGTLAMLYVAVIAAAWWHLAAERRKARRQCAG